MTTVINDEYNEVGSKIVFKIDEMIKVIKVGNHIQCQSQHCFLVNDYQSRISSEIANLNKALENICRILLEQSSESMIKLARRISIINNGTISHSISPSRASEIEDDFSGPPEPGNYSGPVTPESNSGTGKVRIPAKSALFPVPLLDIPYSCLTEKLVTLVDSAFYLSIVCLKLEKLSFDR